MRFLADMGVSQGIVERLRGQGHDAVHLRDQGLQKSPDNEVFAKAATEQRILLTFDLDFGEIVAFSEARNPSVVLFRVQDTRTDQVWARLQYALPMAKEELDSGAIVVVEDRRIRIRRLPIGT